LDVSLRRRLYAPLWAETLRAELLACKYCFGGVTLVCAERGEREQTLECCGDRRVKQAGVRIANVREGGMKRERKTKPGVLKKRRTEVTGNCPEADVW
jgi:hypothetical protein